LQYSCIVLQELCSKILEFTGIRAIQQDHKSSKIYQKIAQKMRVFLAKND